MTDVFISLFMKIPPPIPALLFSALILLNEIFLFGLNIEIQPPAFVFSLF